MPSRRSFLGLSLISVLSTANALATPGFTPRSAMGTYAQYAAATYNLVSTFNSGNWVNSFSFWNSANQADPTSGFVNYLPYSLAVSSGLFNTNNGQVYLGVDSTTVNPANPGRNSLRVTSNQAYTHGLFIADIAHMYAILTSMLS